MINSDMGRETGMESWEMLLKESQLRPEMKLSWEGVRSRDEEAWKTYRGSGKEKEKLQAEEKHIQRPGYESTFGKT